MIRGYLIYYFSIFKFIFDLLKKFIVLEKLLLDISMKLFSLLTEHLKYSDLSLSILIVLTFFSGDEIFGKLLILHF